MNEDVFQGSSTLADRAMALASGDSERAAADLLAAAVGILFGLVGDRGVALEVLISRFCADLADDDPLGYASRMTGLGVAMLTRHYEGDRERAILELARRLKLDLEQVRAKKQSGLN